MTQTTQSLSMQWLSFIHTYTYSWKNSFHTPSTVKFIPPSTKPFYFNIGQTLRIKPFTFSLDIPSYLIITNTFYNLMSLQVLIRPAIHIPPAATRYFTLQIAASIHKPAEIQLLKYKWSPLPAQPKTVWLAIRNEPPTQEGSHFLLPNKPKLGL